MKKTPPQSLSPKTVLFVPKFEHEKALLKHSVFAYPSLAYPTSVTSHTTPRRQTFQGPWKPYTGRVDVSPDALALTWEGVRCPLAMSRLQSVMAQVHLEKMYEGKKSTRLEAQLFEDSFGTLFCRSRMRSWMLYGTGFDLLFNSNESEDVLNKKRIYVKGLNDINGMEHALAVIAQHMGLGTAILDPNESPVDAEAIV